MSLALLPIVDGPDTGETLVFLQGWPDDASLWDEHVATLSERYRCVRTTLPNFDGQPSARRGYGTDEIVEAFAQMIRRVSGGAPVTLILHDWGCYWGHIMHHRYPQLVRRVAGLDVAPHVDPGPGAMLGIMAYQFWLLGAFNIAGPVGDWMTRALAGAFGAPAPRARITAWMNYPYRNFWQDIASGRSAKYNDDYWPQVPLLFVYGQNKPFPFHSNRWLEHVERTGGRVVGLECGHWVSRHASFGGLLGDWLDRTA